MCRQCKKEKDISQYGFHTLKNPSKKSASKYPEGWSYTGYRSACNPCLAKYQSWKRSKYSGAERSEYLKRLRRNSLRRNYGITEEQYNQMLQDQSGGCAICGQMHGCIKNGKKYNLNVDHCHDTKKVRGLLCGPCNVSLGVFHNQKLLETAIMYLARSI